MKKNGARTPWLPGFTRQRRISVQNFRALFHAVLDNPAMIREVAQLHPGLEKRIFGEMLEARPAIDMSTLYRIVIAIGRAEYLHRLVNQAILARKADDLWCAILRLARKWAKDDFIPFWDYEEAAAKEVMRLMLNVSLEFHEGMKAQLNPKYQLWFHVGVDFGQLWRCTIRMEIEAGRWDDAFDSLMTAACGLPTSIHTMERWATSRDFDAVAETKDALEDDEFVWRVYGRVPNFAALVQYMWNAYLGAGLVTAVTAKQRTPHAQMLRFRMRTSQGKVIAEYRSLIGILARGGKGVDYQIVKLKGEQRRRPVFTIGKTLLSPCMAKFQQIVLCHQRRHTAGLRPIVNVHPRPADALLS